MRRTPLFTLVFALLLVTKTSAQEEPTAVTTPLGWYVGAQAGVPMAEGTFSSFGADRFRPGWSMGLHAGYRFSPVWSFEMTASWGQQFLAEQDCCFERGYFLGSDHNRYRDGYYLPAGMTGWSYTDLKSRTFVQRYGLQVNMNILGFFNRTKESRWRLDISPAVYAVGTSSDLMTKADNTPVADNLNDWHLGYGGQAQVSYAVADNMNIGIYGGFTHLTGKPMDGMPELHSTNFIIDAGVKFSFAFGKRKSENGKVKTIMPVTPTVQSTDNRVQITDEREQIAEIVAGEVKGESEKVKTEAELKAENEKVKTEDEDFSFQISDFTFPVVYFSFNSVWIEPSEKAKIKEIADIMKANPEMKIRITGWSDNVGDEEANKRVSLQRAEAVKRMLGKWLIPAERVEALGAGIAHDAQSRGEARHAATIEVK